MVRGKGGGGLIDMYQNSSPYSTEAILSMIPVYLGYFKMAVESCD